MGEKRKIRGKEAAVKAIEYFKEILGPMSGLSIEEIEFDESGPWWMVTLGYPDPHAPEIFYAGKRRLYKVFKINGHSGEVVSMKIKEVKES